MSDRAVLFLISAAVVAACLLGAVWIVASGQAAYLDGLFLLASCLVLAFAFGLYLWSVIRRALEEVRAEAPSTLKAAATGEISQPSEAVSR